jgi:hypothetical protein
MSPYAAEAYKRITGEDPPKPFHEKTLEEQILARDLFLKSVRESSKEEDDAVDELFRIIRENRKLEIWDRPEVEEEIA